MKNVLFLLIFTTTALFGMDQTTFTKLKKQVKDAGFASEKITLVKTAASSNTFTCTQVNEILGEMSFAGDKIKMLKAVKNKLEDPKNKLSLLGSFDFDSDKKKAKKVLAQVKKAAKRIQHAKMPLKINQAAAWSKHDFKRLNKRLKKASFSKDKLDIVKEVSRSSKGFTAKQMFKILKTFGFGNDMVKAVKILDKQILELYSTQVSKILKAFSFSNDKLKALKTLKNTIVDAENKFVILDQFDFGSDKEKAREILKTVKPRSFIYGTIYSNRVVFVVDTSGSMAATFTTNQGERLTRLNFVTRELKKVIQEQFDDETAFNIITFSNGVRQWQPSLVPATQNNIKMALAYLSKLRPGGGTNIHDSLQKAFSNKNVNAVYFLTDGQPTAGAKRDQVGIIQAVKSWRKGRDIPVHTAAFLMGYFSGDNKPASRSLMSALAEATLGMFRSIE